MPHTSPAAKLVQCQLEPKRSAAPYCSLREATTEGRRWTKDDHIYKCRKFSCIACGRWLMNDWVRTHLKKAAVVLDETISFTLLWPALSISNGAIAGTIEFLEATKRLTDILNQQSAKLENEVFMIVSHYNCPPKAGMSIIRPHLHLCLAGPCTKGNQTWMKLAFNLKKLWKSFGGKSIYVKPPSEKGFDGFLRYMNKHPLKSFTEKEMTQIDHTVFKEVESRMGNGVVYKAVGGALFSPNGFLKLRAYLRYSLLNKSMTLKQRSVDADRTAEFPMTRLRCLRYVEECPNSCRVFDQIFIEKQGKMVCARCGESWIPKPVLWKHARAMRQRRRRTLITRLVENSIPIDKIASRVLMKPFQIRLFIQQYFGVSFENAYLIAPTVNSAPRV